MKFFNTPRLDKVLIVKEGEFGEVYKYFDRDQMEKIYGGRMSDVKEGAFWPPRCSESDLVKKKDLVKKNIDFFSIVSEDGDCRIFVGEEPIKRLGDGFEPNISEDLSLRWGESNILNKISEESLRQSGSKKKSEILSSSISKDEKT
jgi:hypothetical protein